MRVVSLASLALVSSVVSAHLTAAPMQVVGTPVYSEGCGRGSDMQITEDNKIELILPDFEAVTTPDAPRVRKNCVVKATIKAPPGYKLAPQTLSYEGAAKISETGSGNITARYYFTGHESLAGYQSFTSLYDDIFTVSTSGQYNSYTACGGQAEFNFMGDIVARGSAQDSSEVVVQRGNASADVPEDTPVVQCGIKVVRCN